MQLRAARCTTSELAQMVHRLEEVGAQLRQERAALEVTSRHKSDFLASMSHELRTPLNAIIGFSEVLLDHGTPAVHEDQRRTFLEYIRGSGQHLLGLINDILDIAKVEAGMMDLHLEPIAVGNLIEDCVAMMRVIADTKRIALDTAFEPADGVASIDQPRVKQIVYNLLSNAVKFTQPGGCVIVSGTLTQTELRVAVRDDGVGIPREEQALIFQEFHQGPATSAGSGTGLGLALVRKLVELQAAASGLRVSLDKEAASPSRFHKSYPFARMNKRRSGLTRSRRRSAAVVRLLAIAFANRK